MSRRGKEETKTFRAAMLDELEKNKSKGGWSEMSPEEAAWELFYHAFKLAYATKTGLPQDAILELAADVGNHSMFIADNAGALDEGVPAEPTTFQKDRPDFAKCNDGLKAWFTKHFGKVDTPSFNGSD